MAKVGEVLSTSQPGSPYGVNFNCHRDEREYTLIKRSNGACRIWLFRDPEGFA